MADQVMDDRRRRLDTLLWTVVFVWLYTVPFLLLVGLIRRTSSLKFLTYEQGKAVGTVTDWYLMAGLVLNVVPLIGLAVAGLTRLTDWQRRFGVAAGWALAVYLVFGIVSSMATAPLIGFQPGPDLPAPPGPTQCIPRSGGHSCPGG